jgi:DNA-binding GntR family transcriptional regulator
MEENKPKKTLARYTAYEAIKNKILYLELRPGDVISEAQIAKSLGVGRTPAREALLLLEKEGLIEIKENVGFTVRKFGLEETEEYRLVRTLIEEYAVSMAIQRITKEELEALRENVKQLSKTLETGDLMSAVRYESEFHEMIYRAARSDVVRETVSGLNSKFLWIRAAALSKKGAVAQCVIQHSQILQEIEKKDIGGAKKRLRQHLKNGWGRLVDLRWLFGGTDTGKLGNK